MRILIIISSLRGGGAERTATNLAEHWASEGQTVRLVTVASSRSDFYRLSASVSRVDLDLERRSPNLVAAVWNNLMRILALRRQITEFSPDVVIAMMTSLNVLTAVAARGRNPIVIGCERTHPPQNPLGPIREFARGWGYGLLHAVVALTEESAVWLRKKTRARLVRVIPNSARWPLPGGPPSISPETVCREGRKILLAAGRLESEKGFLGLLSVFSEICAEHSSWDLVVLGEGSLRSQLEGFIHDKNLKDRIFLPGRVGNVDDWYSRSSLFVLSSVFEGFPNTLVEAMAYGLPAVSYDCDTGPRDIIRNEIDGILVPSGEPGQLKDGLRRLMDSDELRLRFSRRAGEIRERLSGQVIMQRWNELFRELIRHDI